MNINKYVKMVFIQLFFTLFWATLTTPTNVVASSQNDVTTEGILFLTNDDSSPDYPLVTIDQDDDGDDFDEYDNDVTQKFSHDYEFIAKPRLIARFQIAKSLQPIKPSTYSLARPVQKRLFLLFNRLKLDCWFRFFLSFFGLKTTFPFSKQLFLLVLGWIICCFLHTDGRSFDFFPFYNASISCVKNGLMATPQYAHILLIINSL